MEAMWAEIPNVPKKVMRFLLEVRCLIVITRNRSGVILAPSVVCL